MNDDFVLGLFKSVPILIPSTQDSRYQPTLFNFFGCEFKKSKKGHEIYNLKHKA